MFEQQGSGRAECGRCLERHGWGSGEAAGEGAAAGAVGEGVLWCVQCAQWTVVLTLMLGRDLDVATWV